MQRVTIVGCGDIGHRVAMRLPVPESSVSCWVRSHASARKLQGLGLASVAVDLDDPAISLPAVAGHSLFYFAPPPGSGVEDMRVAALIREIAETGHPYRVVYLSTSGVYGDCDGEWVDEQHPPSPRADRAWRRLDAERRWREWSLSSGGELVILRVAGIYGPGKLPLKRLQSGAPMVAETDSPITNHIHSLDLVDVCLAAMARGRSGEVYNVSDGHPGTMTAYFDQVADFLGLARPPVISLAEAKRRLSPGMLSYLAESRRLSNRKMVEELEVGLRYPTLAEGLPASLDEEQGGNTQG